MAQREIQPEESGGVRSVGSTRGFGKHSGEWERQVIYGGRVFLNVS